MGLKAVIVLLGLWVALALSQYPTTVDIANYGTIQGFEVQSGNVTVNAFVGVPYAAPPVGDLRFQYTQAAPAIPGVFDATSYGNICPQLLNGAFDFPNSNSSEDCLTLNIWAPNTDGLKPVLFWIHAGGFIQGSGSEYRYHGSNLAAQENIVVVTFNYRLGALGSLAHPSLDALYNNSGTYTLADQVFAFQWVLANIANFGGDVSRITVGGISAGGAATVYLLANENVNLNIAQAIVSSGDPISQAQSKDSGLLTGLQVSSALYCNGTDDATVACLRAATPDQYINLAPYASSSKVSVDMVYLMDSPYNLITQGAVRQVPTLFGTTFDEATLFIYSAQVTPLSQAAYRPFLSNLMNGYVPGLNTYSVVNTYPCADFNPSDCRVAASVAASDAVLNCQTNLFAENYASFGYVMRYRPSYIPAELGEPHLVDIPYHFNSLSLTNFQYGPEDQEVADYVSRYFGSFITTGNPNYPDAPAFFPDYRGPNGTFVRKSYEYPDPGTPVVNYKTASTGCGYWSAAYGQLAAAEMVANMTNSTGSTNCPTPSPMPSPSSCPLCPTSSPWPTPSPCPAVSPCPTASGCPVPLPCPTCPSGSGSTNINFYFADMLSGVKATPSPSSSASSSATPTPSPTTVTSST
eukprot:TRINITY_DN21810_c0_g1_i1.p1 TRINITY_DN21810_c0_g1~~TRINITY_DN21810_c0_g1_i1.p1  ORF type:complete len:635 (+),score=159.32 TRINITY_DN21810_c0_g1_i1:35-1939(+)